MASGEAADAGACPPRASGTAPAPATTARSALGTRGVASAPSEPGPVGPEERIPALDVIRGAALLGIVVVNWSVDLLWRVQPWAGFTSVPDQAAFWAVQLLLKEKSWPVFAFLFGLGFALQMERAEARGPGGAARYLRRLAVLFLIGAAHFVLTDRDIVHMYAVLGVLLLPLRRLPPRWLPPLALACVLTVWGGTAISARARAAELAASAPRVLEPAARQARLAALRAAAASSAYGRATFGELARARARQLGRALGAWKTYVIWLGEPFPPFLLGLYVGRRGIVRDLDARRAWLRAVMGWALAIGIAGTLVYTVVELGALQRGVSPGYTGRQLARLAERVGSPALGIGYTAGLALLLGRARWARRLAVLAPYGRMALTNYLFQSVCFVLIFFGYGLGWFGTVGAFGGLALAAPVLVVGVVASRWWLGRFRFGPVEWLWRTLTYGARQPMRVARVPAEVPGA